MPLPIPPNPTTLPDPVFRHLVIPIGRKVAQMARDIWHGPPDRPLGEEFSPATQSDIGAIPPYVRKLMKDRGVPILERDMPISRSGEYIPQLGKARVELATAKPMIPGATDIIDDLPGH